MSAVEVWTGVLDAFEARLDAVADALADHLDLSPDGALAAAAFELPPALPPLPDACVERARRLAARNATVAEAARDRLAELRRSATPPRPAPLRRDPARARSRFEFTA